VRDVLGEGSAEFRGWDGHLSPRWRGEAVQRAYLTMFDAAIAVAEGNANASTAGAASVLAEIDRHRDGRIVGNVLGPTGLRTFRQQTSAEQLQTITTAFLLQMALQASTVLEI
jgi:hypothetical protein